MLQYQNPKKIRKGHSLLTSARQPRGGFGVSRRNGGHGQDPRTCSTSPVRVHSLEGTRMCRVVLPSDYLNSEETHCILITIWPSKVNN